MKLWKCYLRHTSLTTEFLALTELSWGYNLHLTTHTHTHSFMSQSPDEMAHFPPPPCFPSVFHSLLPATADTERLPSSTPLRGGFPPYICRSRSVFRRNAAVDERTLLRKYPARFSCLYIISMKFPLCVDSLFINVVFLPPYISSWDHFISFCHKGHKVFSNLLNPKMSPGGKPQMS